MSAGIEDKLFRHAYALLFRKRPFCTRNRSTVPFEEITASVGVQTPYLLLGFVPLPSGHPVIATPLLMAVNLPEDILALVFDGFANDQVLRWPDAEYDHAKALAPFTLAAVCQRWRYLALSLAPIWDYFGFPADHPALHLHHSRLLALLDRSKDTLVDVVVTMGTAYNYRSYDRNLQSGAIF